MTVPLPSQGSTSWYTWASDIHTKANAALPTSSGYTDEQAQDATATMIASGTHTGLTTSYNDAANTLSFTVTGSGGGGTTVTPVSTPAPREVLHGAHPDTDHSVISLTTSSSTQAGDTVFVVHGNDWNSASNMAAPGGDLSGWTLVTSADGGLNSAHIKVWRTTTGTGGAHTVTVAQANPGSDSYFAAVYVFPGTVVVDASNSATGSAATAHVAPATRAIAQSRLLLSAWQSAYSATGGDSTYSAVPSGMTQQTLDHEGAVSSGTGAMLTATKAITSGGAIGTQTATYSTSRVFATVSVVLAPVGYSSVSLADFGATGDGGDATTAFDQARAASYVIDVPAGAYQYTGNGLEANGLVLTGAGAENTNIILGTGKSLVVAADYVIAMEVTGLRVTGGFGAVRLSAPVFSVHEHLLVQRCQFINYTGVAVSSAALDQPYWRVIDNEFYANDDTSTTMGVALAGDNAGAIISGNHFEKNRVHLKLGQDASGTGASAVHVHDNDFIRFGAPSGTARTDIWLVPNDQVRSSGFLCHDNKFGSENLGPDDYRVLYADENAGSGSDVATRIYSTATSSRRISGQIYRGNYQGSPSTARIPFITSYVPWTLAQVVRDHTLDGSVPTYIMDMRATTTTDASFSTSVIGPVASSEVGITGATGMQACNVSGYVVTIDPTNQLQQTGAPLPQQGGSSLTGFVDLTSSLVVGSYGLAGATTRAAATDSLGGSDAGTITVPSGSIYAALTGLTVGVPVWIEFDARLGGANQVTSILVSTAVSGADRWRRQVPLTSSWKRWRFLFTPKDAAVNQITFYPPTTTGSFDLGRVRVYHASEPVAMDLRVGTSTTANRPTGVPTGRQWYDTTLGKPIWWNGTVWKDAAGTTV